MKSLVALMLLINLLGYLMMTNVPESSSSANPTFTYQKFDSSQALQSKSLVLLSELSDLDRALLAVPFINAHGTKDDVQVLCDVVGPFTDSELADAALAMLLPDFASIEGLILESSSAEFWLSIPTSETLVISLNSQPQFETKKRYLEGCMEVASGLKFH
jgi:hypothetical protein